MYLFLHRYSFAVDYGDIFGHVFIKLRVPNVIDSCVYVFAKRKKYPIELI